MRVLREPMTWIVVLRIACGLWFFASGVRKANTRAITGLIPDEVAKYADLAPSPYRGFLQRVVIPHARTFAVLVVGGEIGVGLGLAVGLLTTIAASVGIFLNLNYLLAAGRQNHAEQAQNGAMILIQLAVLATNAGRVAGVDALVLGAR